MLRIPANLHARLRDEAEHEGLSLNAYCVQLLQHRSPHAALPKPAQSLVRRATELFGNDVMGVLLFGSWARGQAGAGSDVDALIVLADRVRITRDRYRQWDAEPLTWEGRPVEAHLVHLPKESNISGVWAEAALDGIVLFERELVVSRALGRIRRVITERRLVRRVVHGQPYWAEGA